MESIIILIDNLRIGGFQRVALDEAFGLSKLGYEIRILVLDSRIHIDSHNFLIMERERINNFSIKVDFVGQRLFSQLLDIYKTQKKEKGAHLIVSHSLRATVLSKICSILLRADNCLVSTIHQIPTLSAPLQRFKRFLYAQFSDELLSYSQAVKLDWDERISRSFVFTRIFRKEINLNRNGIFLDRLPREYHSASSRELRLIYLGRNTNWKGLKTFIDLAETASLAKSKLLLIIPDFSMEDVERLAPNLSHRVEILESRNLEDYSPSAGDVHVYPVDYGNLAKFIESISLNCLEMACLGIPSFVTKGGLLSWPEISNFKIFFEADWNDLDSVSMQIKFASEGSILPEQITQLREIFGIQNHLETYLKLRKAY